MSRSSRARTMAPGRTIVALAAGFSMLFTLGVAPLEVASPADDVVATPTPTPILMDGEEVTPGPGAGDETDAPEEPVATESPTPEPTDESADELAETPSPELPSEMPLDPQPMILETNQKLSDDSLGMGDVQIQAQPGESTTTTLLSGSEHSQTVAQQNPGV